MTLVIRVFTVGGYEKSPREANLEGGERNVGLDPAKAIMGGPLGVGAARGAHACCAYSS